MGEKSFCEKHPSGAEAHVDFVALAARPKGVRFQNGRSVTAANERAKRMLQSLCADFVLRLTTKTVSKRNFRIAGYSGTMDQN
jgi:hypothetical protein